MISNNKHKKILHIVALYLVLFFLTTSFLGVLENLTIGWSGNTQFYVFNLFIFVVPILLVWLVHKLIQRSENFAKNIYPVLAFFAGLFGGYIFTSLFTWGVLIPWEFATNVRPKTGIAIQVNDFFNSSFGSLLLTYIFALVHVGLAFFPKTSQKIFFQRLSRLANLMGVFVLVNFLGFFIFAVFLAIPFPNIFRFVDGPSYINSIVPLILHTAIFIWYGFQVKKQLQQPYEPLT